MSQENHKESNSGSGQKKEPDSVFGLIKSLPPMLIIVEIIIISVFIYFFFFF